MTFGESKTLDSALKKLIDRLPTEDPDKADEPERIMVDVWSPWFKGRHTVQANVMQQIFFGKWYGPEGTYLRDVQFFARVHGSANERDAEIIWEDNMGSTYLTSLISLNAQLVIHI